MLDISGIKTGRVIKENKEPYLVIWTQQVQMGRGGSILRTKLRNLVNGAVLEKTYKGAEKTEEADLERGKATFLYRKGEELFFMDNSSYEQFILTVENVGTAANFLKEGTEVTVLNFESRPVAVQVPIKVELKVVQTPPGVKGDTAGSATKVATLETGYELNVPLFVKEGEIIRINTEKGEYVERVT